MPYWDFALRRTYNGGMACIPQQAMVDSDPFPHFTVSASGIKLLPKLPPFPNNPLYAYRYPLQPGKTLQEYGIVNVTEKLKDGKPGATMPVSS